MPSQLRINHWGDGQFEGEKCNVIIYLIDLQLLRTPRWAHSANRKLECKIWPYYLEGRRKGNIFSHSVRHKKIILPRKGPVFFTYFNANVMRCSVAATGERKGNVGRWVAA